MSCLSLAFCPICVLSYVLTVVQALRVSAYATTSWFNVTFDLYYFFVCIEMVRLYVDSDANIHCQQQLRD